MTGWVKLWRQWEENPYLQHPVRIAVFFTLLSRAQHEPKEVYVRSIERIIKLNRGQCYVSPRAFAKKFKCGYQQIRSALETLKSGALINAESNAGITIITICNYEKYQSREDGNNAATNAQDNARVTHRQRTEQECKEGEEDKEKKDYAFCGKIIRLTQNDYDRWAKSFHTLDLKSELTALDDYYADNGVNGQWFPRCSQALSNRHSKNMQDVPAAKKYDRKHWKWTPGGYVPRKDA